ncbi:hypothetical protein EV174_001296 [Coemansia sp. RSA 2320]|nr:hypothetical protein EV174_001296 [Coemansia sp. RSA 2320]
MLITAYAKLGLLDDSRRLYQEALRSGVYECMDHIEWSMCLALFRSSRHREARAIFDKLAHANRATPGMYDLLAREYVLLQNKERAFALLDDMRRLDMRPTRSCFNVLATACSLDRDGDRGSARLSELIVCMASWGWAPDKEFFLNLLKGYHWSNQHSMFDGLIRRLRAHGLGSDPMLCKIALVNAVARQDLDLVASMAPLAARAPGNIAKVVQVLAQLGLASDLPACANLAQYPDNNIMARIRLDIAQNSPVLIACPQSLVDALECMVEGGFTPSFRQFHHAIHRIYLQGGPMLAIQTYKRLAAAGAPASINLQFLVLQMHVELGDSEAALTVFDELRNQLKDTEFTTLRFHPKPLKALVRLLMEKHGVTAAQQAFDFLTTLPISRRHLPYSLMIEYYLGHRMVDDSRSLISHAVQHDIPLQPRIIDSYCRHLELHSSTTDLANFLRYVQRTRFLSLVADDVLETFFALCALEHKISDLEWITEQLVLMRGRANAWTAIIDRLAVVDIHILSFIVHFAIEKSWRRQDMAVLLLECSMRSPCRAKLAEVVLAGLEAQNMQPGRRVYQMAIAAFAHSWMKHYSRLGNPADPFASREFLINALRQYVPWAVEVGISPSLITNSLLALSSASRFAYKECLDLLLDMRPELLDGRFYCAIATSCARRGMAVEIDKVLEAMQRQGVLPTSNVLVSLMHCYANVRPPPVRPDYSLSGSEPLSNALVPASSHDDQPHCQPPSLGHSRFYAWNLERVLSVWERFKHHGLPVSAAAYAVLARAHIKAGQYEAIELVFADMLRQGICHSEDTALMWIQGRLMQNDVRGALLVFAAIGSSSRCAELARTDSCYESLDLVRRSSRHFGAVIEHYVRTSELAHAVAIMSAMHQEGLEAGAGLYAMLLGRLVQADSRELFVNVLRQLSKAGVKMDEQLMPIIRDYVAHIKGQRPAVGVADKSDVGADIDSSSSDNDGSGRLPPS